VINLNYFFGSLGLLVILVWQVLALYRHQRISPCTTWQRDSTGTSWRWQNYQPRGPQPPFFCWTVVSDS